MTSPIKTLVDKLDPTCHSALTKAASLCVTRTHYNIELEHYLLSLLENDNSLLVLMLKQAQCDPDKLKMDINRSLESLNQGNDQAPSISARVLDLINESWLLASLEYSGQHITSGILLCALVENRQLNQVCHAISQEFTKLSDKTVRSVMESAAQQLNEPESLEENNTPQKPTKTPALDQFTTNLNEQAENGKIDAAIGRDDEIRQVIDILSRRRQNNAILTGEPGVGKTAIVEGFALKIVAGDVPKSLENVVIHSLDMGLLQAGAGVKGEFENRLKSLIKEIKGAPYPIILFIDEAHTLIGAGAASGQNDAANLLKPALARGELRSIAATTWAEYKQHFEKDAALTRRFQVVKIEEPDTENAIRMLRSLTPSLEKHHNIRILDDAVRSATLLSKRYITGRQLPDKSISVLDTACARVGSKQTTTPPGIELASKLLEQLRLESANLTRESQQGIDHSERLAELNSEITKQNQTINKLNEQWQQEKIWVNKIIDLGQKLDALMEGTLSKNKPSKSLAATQTAMRKAQAQLKKIQGEAPLAQAYVDAEAVAEVIADWTGIPVGKMQQSEVSQILNLPEELNKRVVGQDDALETIASTVRTSSVKLTDPNKPIGVFLFVGPSGVGKTETAIALAEQLYGSEDKMTTINMSEFKEEHKVSMLAGSPPGYVGYGEGGVLTEAVRRKPYSLVLLDEMEKAHPGIQDVFYQVFDKGTLKDGQGRDINFKNTLIIMTSNACSELITSLCDDPETMPDFEALASALHDELTKTFKPAFLGRVTIVPYIPLEQATLEKIIKLKLARIQKRVQQEHKIDLKVTAKVIEIILSQCEQAEIGARQVDNIINKILLPKVSEIFLSQLIEKTSISELTIDADKNGELLFKPFSNRTNKARSKKGSKHV